MDIDSEKFYVRIEQKTPEAGVYKTSHMWVSDGTCRAFMRMLQRMFEHGDQPRIIVRLRQEPATEEERAEILAEREKDEFKRKYPSASGLATSLGGPWAVLEL